MTADDAGSPDLAPPDSGAADPQSHDEQLEAFRRRLRERAQELPPGAIGMPAVDWIWTECAKGVCQLQQFLPPGSTVWFEDGHSTIAAKRNRIVMNFLERPELEWLLFLDSDMVPTWGTVDALLAAERDVIGALCFKRGPPYTPCAGDDDGSCLNELTRQRYRRVHWVGTGAMMIRRRVLEGVPAPWFRGDENGQQEDNFFCGKAQEHGFEVWLHQQHVVGHRGGQTIDLDWSLTWWRGPGPAQYAAARKRARERQRTGGLTQADDLDVWWR